MQLTTTSRIVWRARILSNRDRCQKPHSEGKMRLGDGGSGVGAGLSGLMRGKNDTLARSRSASISPNYVYICAHSGSYRHIINEFYRKLVHDYF